MGSKKRKPQEYEVGERVILVNGKEPTQVLYPVVKNLHIMDKDKRIDLSLGN